jgi:hypothetical protein
MKKKRKNSSSAIGEIFVFAKNSWLIYNPLQFNLSSMDPLAIPPLAKHVTDYSSALSSEQTELLSTKFAEHENTTTEQVLTVLIPHRQWHELRDIWLKLFNENGIGQRDLNNWLLLIVSTEEKKLRIITGKGMEIKYSEMVCRDIVETTQATARCWTLCDPHRYMATDRQWHSSHRKCIIPSRGSYTSCSWYPKTSRYTQETNTR